MDLFSKKTRVTLRKNAHARNTTPYYNIHFISQ